MDGTIGLSHGSHAIRQSLGKIGVGVAIGIEFFQQNHIMWTEVTATKADPDSDSDPDPD